MTIYIHYQRKPGPGYTPRDPIKVHNIRAVEDFGPHMVKVAFIFQDDVITHDHVDRIVIEPDGDE